MTEHVTQWLEAYYDGEIKGRRARQIEAHLETCKTCQAELESLAALSTLLKKFPEARNLTPADTFTAQVGLRLPREFSESKRNSIFRTGWQWAPIGLLAAWVFLQTAFIVSAVVSWAVRVLPGMEQFASILQDSTQAGSMANLTGTGFSELSQFGLEILRSGGPLGWVVTLNFAFTLILGLLYLSWLASWWIQKPNGDELSSKI